MYVRITSAVGIISVVGVVCGLENRMQYAAKRRYFPKESIYE